MRNTLLIIIEGLDNTGKTTLIKRITNVLTLFDKKVITIHSEKPPKDINISPDQYLHNYYLNTLMTKLIRLKNEGDYDYIILDRGWLSEYVYGSLYRNRSKLDIVEDNIILDKKVLKLFESFSGEQNVYLIMLSGNPDFLLKNDDNLSLSKKDKNLIYREISLFQEAYRDSLIKNKHYFIVGSNSIDNYREILPEIFDFINV